jgi:hypothetical protein
MTSPQQLVAQQEFRTAKGWRIFIYVLSPPLILAFLAAPFVFWWEGPRNGITMGLGFVMFAMALFFLYGLLETHKAKHIITADSLLYEGALRRKAIPLANIKGYRIDQQYTNFYSNNPADPSIRIGYTSENYEAMQRWFADRYPDLDQQEQAHATALLVADTSLGTSPEDREATLTSAQRTAQYLNIVGGAVAVWLFFLPEEHYRWAMALALAVPLLAAGALWRHAGVLRPDERRNSAYPSVAIALTAPSALLLLRGMLDFELLAYAPLWIWVAGIVGALALALVGGSWHFVRRNDGRLGLLFSVLFIAVMYGFGAAISYNCAFDESLATRYKTQVINKHCSSGKTTTYYLEVKPWGPRTEAADIIVDRNFYQRKSPGDPISVYLKAGQLQVPWFQAAD